MKTTKILTGAILTAAILMFAQNSVYGQTTDTSDNYGYAEYQAKVAAERRISDSLAWVNEQNEIAHASAIEAATQEQILAASAKAGQEREQSDMMAWAREQHDIMVKKYADSVLLNEIIAASADLVNEMEFEAQYSYAHQQEYETRIEAEILAACTQYAKERELEDMMNYSMELHRIESQNYNDSVINAEILASCAQISAEREFEDAHSAAVQQHMLDAKLAYEAQIEAEILAACQALSAEMEEYYRNLWMLENNPYHSNAGMKNETLAVSEENVTESSLVSVQVYPNPATEYVTVEVANGQNENDEVSIIDLSGKLIFKAPLNNNTTMNIDVTSYTQGYYIVRYTNEKGDDITKKFVKQ